MDVDPIVATNAEKRYYYDSLFRSHQKLLVDTAVSEYLFLAEFFGSHGDALFAEVLKKTVTFFLETLEVYLPSAYDAVGLLLMLRIVEHHREAMRQHQLRCLDSYLDQVLLLLLALLRTLAT